MPQKTLDVIGMHCASCVSRVERALLDVQNVDRAAVNLLAKRADVWHDSDVGTETLVDAVRSAGFDAVLRDGAGLAARRSAPPAYGEGRLGARFAYTFTAAWAAMFLSMPLMHHESSAGPAGAFSWVMVPVDVVTRAVFPFLYGWPVGALHWVLFAITLPVLLWSGRHFFVGTMRGLPRGRFDMDALVAIGTGTAFLYSAVVTAAPDLVASRGLPREVYFEAVPWVIALVTLGRLLEERAKRRAGEAVRALADRMPRSARVRRDGQEVDVPLEDVRVGDEIVLRPGEKVPVDGTIETGQTSLDESLLTGESVPVQRGPGDPVKAGTLNGVGGVTFRAEKVGADTAIARIVALLEEAMAGKPEIQRIVDRVAAVFVPVVLVLAVLTFAAWMVFGPGFAWAIRAFVAVLIIACPCALGLAVPAAISVATGRAAKLGMLVRDGSILETAHRVDTVVLDKTGTVTIGRPEVVSFERSALAAVPDDREVLSLAAALERRSEHPLAGAIIRYAEAREAPDVEATAAFTKPGGGVFGKVGEQRVRVGTVEFLREKDADPGPLRGIASRMEARGETPVLVAVDGVAVAAFGVRDPIQEGAADAVRALEDLGLRVVLLSGDRRGVAEHVATEVGIRDVVAPATPEEKIAHVRMLRAQGRVVLMAGDGVNDAPALAEADLGVAMGGGADVAREAADVTLVSGRLSSLPAAVRLSRATIRVLRQNLAWAFGYNVLAIPLAAGLFYPWTGWMLSPVVASAAMALSSVSVVSNSLRLGRFR